VPDGRLPTRGGFRRSIRPYVFLNIRVLVQSICELGLEPVFWTFEAKEPVASKQFAFAGF